MPMAIGANLPDSISHQMALLAIKYHRLGFQFYFMLFFENKVRVYAGTAENIMEPIYRTSFIARQPSAIGTKRN